MTPIYTVGDLRRALADYPDDLRVAATWEGTINLLSLEGVDDSTYIGRVLFFDAELGLIPESWEKGEA